MRYVASYLLAQLGGKNDPNLEDLKKILGSVGIDVDEAIAKKVISSLKGKNIEELVEQGKLKLASIPSAGAVAVSAGSAAGAPAAGGAAAKEEKKEEKKKEEKEESDDDMGFGLFD